MRDETDSEIIFAGHMDSEDAMSLMGQEGMNVVSDDESAIGNPLMTEAHVVTADDEVEPQGKIFFWGMWRDSS